MSFYISGKFIGYIANCGRWHKPDTRIQENRLWTK